MILDAVFHLSYLDVAQPSFGDWHDVGRKYLRQHVRCELDRGQVVLLTRLSFGRRKVHLDPTFLGWRPNTVGFVHEY